MSVTASVRGWLVSTGIIGALGACASAPQPVTVAPRPDAPRPTEAQPGYPDVNGEAYPEHQDTAEPDTAPEVADIESAGVSLNSPGQGSLQIYVFDVGQADSMLVVGPKPQRRTLLIDLGEERGAGRENYLHVAQRILDITGKAVIDYFVVSHFHADHVGSKYRGVAGLLDGIEPEFHIRNFIDLGEDGTQFMSPTRGTKVTLEENLARWLGEHKVDRRMRPEFGAQQVDLGTGVTVEFVTFGGKASAAERGVFSSIEDLYPGQYERAPGSENDISIGLEVSFGEFEFFTAGDLTGYAPADWTNSNTPKPPMFTPRSFGGGKSETYTNVESHLARVWKERGRDSDVEVYRANHHGSHYSSSPEFLEALDPEVVIYSCGGQGGEGYGHPDADVIATVADTAEQFTTGTVATKSRAAFAAASGKSIGDVAISVNEAGTAYSIQGKNFRKEYRAWTDAAEKAENDR